MTPAAKKPEATKAVTQQATTVVAAQPQPTTPSKQEQTLAKLKAAWAERKVDLSKMEVKDDGKFKLINVGPGWPVIVIGAAGGLDIPAIKSFPKAWDAALIANQLLAKQQERTAKKQATSAPAKPGAIAQAPEAKKVETAATRKERQHKQIEAQMA